jgi:hypothetical protein
MSCRRWSPSRWRLVCALGLLTVPGVSRAALEPCKLLTPAQVAAALGGSFGAGQPIGTTGCSWTSATPHVIVTVSLWPPEEWNRVKAGPLPGAKITPAAGLGNDAFYVTVAPYAVLYVKKGETAFLVKVYGVKDQAQQMSAEKSLALDVLAKL